MAFPIPSGVAKGIESATKSSGSFMNAFPIPSFTGGSAGPSNATALSGVGGVRFGDVNLGFGWLTLLGVGLVTAVVVWKVAR